MRSITAPVLMLSAVGAAMAASPAVMPRHQKRTSSISGRSTPSSGCGVQPAIIPGHLTNQTLELSSSGSGRRPYELWIPPDYPVDSPPEEPYPLIISLHGASRTPDSQAALDQLTNNATFNTDHIVVYPSSTTLEDGSRYWQGSRKLPGDVDDIGYVLEVLDVVSSQYCVDTSRVYATGKSQGGGLVNLLACDQRSNPRFAAFAPVAGAYYQDLDDNASGAAGCDADTVNIQCDMPEDRKGSTYIMALHGGADGTIYYEGGERSDACLPSIEHFVEEWVERQGLAEPWDPATEGLGDKSLPLTDEATVSSWGGRGFPFPPFPPSQDEKRHEEVEEEGDWQDGTVIFVYAGDNVDHDWMATRWNSDNTDHESGPASFDASSLIMDFFRRHSL